MPAEGLPNSQSGRVFPSPPGYPWTCQCACPAALLTQSKKLQRGEAAPDTAAAFPFGPPPHQGSTRFSSPGLVQDCFGEGSENADLGVGWSAVGKAVPGPGTQRECPCRGHCNANGWQDRTTKGNTQRATLLSHPYQLQSVY